MYIQEVETMQRDQSNPTVESLTAHYPEVNSSNLGEIEALVRRLDKNNSEHIFELIYALHKIEEGELYKRIPGCTSISQYYEMCEERLNMPKQTLSFYRRVKDGYVNNVTMLDSHGIEVKGKLVHLAYLEKAFNTHGRNFEEIFTKMKDLSAREFMDYARGEKTPKEQASKEEKSSKGNSRGVAAYTLEEEHEEIAKILMRRNQVFILRVNTTWYAQYLQAQLRYYRAGLIERLTKKNEEDGVIIDPKDPFNLPPYANIFAYEKAIKLAEGQRIEDQAAIAVSVARISSEKKLTDQWKDLGYQSAKDYFQDKIEYVGYRYYWYRKIGLALLDHGKELANAGFSIHGGLYKLYYLETALKKADEKSIDHSIVYSAISHYSFRDFKEYSKNLFSTKRNQGIEYLPTAVVRRAEKDWMSYVARIKAEGDVPAIFELYSEDEKGFIRHAHKENMDSTMNLKDVTPKQIDSDVA
jgi:hypothetical protein